MRWPVSLVLAACGGGSWKPVVWNAAPPADSKASPVAFEFPDGANGTELVIGVLAYAKQTEAAGISGFEIQVGSCTRTVTMTSPTAVASTTDPQLDRITLRMQEAKVTCKTTTDQEVEHGGTDSGTERGKLGDANMVQKESCDQAPIDHVVTRYRFEVDHRFTTPDWAEIARWTHARLAFDAPRCGAVAKNEVRAILHHAAQPTPPPPARTPDAVATIIDLSKRAEAAKLPGAATDLAQRALAVVAATDDLMTNLDDARANELADRIAAAYFFAVAMDVDIFLRRDPKELTDSWAAEVGVDIDRIAKRYEHIKDMVRLPVVVRWLRAGATQLARMHDHVADVLEASHQTAAAEAERARAAALR